MNRYVACIGNFDGVHLAHQKLIELTVDTARKKNLKSRVITFTPEPSIFYSKSRKHQRILTTDRIKKKLFTDYGIDEVIFIRFSDELASMNHDEFVRKYLNDIDTLVCGFDFTYGKNAEGNIETLKNYTFNLEVVEQIDYYQKKISTTRIIKLISSGRIRFAEKLLNHPYYVEFEVIDGIIHTDNVLPDEGILTADDISISFRKKEGEYVTEDVKKMDKMISILTTI